MATIVNELGRKLQNSRKEMKEITLARKEIAPIKKFERKPIDFKRS